MSSSAINQNTLDPDYLDERKEHILRLGQHAVERRGQRRRARQHALLTLLLTAGVTVLAITLAPKPIAPSSPTPIADATPSPSITRVATTAGLASTLAISNTPTIAHIAPDTSRIARVGTPSTPTERLTDLEALALLREAGTPAGLITIEGHTTLVYHDQAKQDGPSSQTGPAPTTSLLAALPIGRPYRPM